MTAQPLRLVAYTSRYAGHDVDADLADIGRRSVANNKRDGITGVLVYDRGTLIQAIEGPHDAVERLLLRVADDRRAIALEVLFDLTVEERSMEEWLLNSLRTDSMEGVDAETLLSFRDAYVRTMKPDAAGFIALLRRLLTLR